jgi:hypothetical protein
MLLGVGLAPNTQWKFSIHSQPVRSLTLPARALL